MERESFNKGSLLDWRHEYFSLHSASYSIVNKAENHTLCDRFSAFGSNISEFQAGGKQIVQSSRPPEILTERFVGSKIGREKTKKSCSLRPSPLFTLFTFQS